VIAFIPMAIGHRIESLVIESLLKQRVGIDIAPCMTPKLPIKLEGELNSRNLIRGILENSHYSEEFVVVQDSDMVHLFDTNLIRCIDYLLNNPNFAGVALPAKMGGHLKHQSSVWRTSFMRSYVWNTNTVRNHICPNLKTDVEKAGMGYDFLPTDKPLVKEIKRKP